MVGSIESGATTLTAGTSVKSPKSIRVNGLFPAWPGIGDEYSDGGVPLHVVERAPACAGSSMSHGRDA